MQHRRTAFFLITLCLTALLNAQAKSDITYGRVSDDDRRLMAVPGDTTAEAYVLYDRLALDFSYNDTDGPGLIEQYHHRLKLIKPSSFDRADVVLRYRRGYQEIRELRAAVHLPSGGSIVLGEADFIRQRLDDTYDEVKWTFPRVTPGAIVEYTYTKADRGILIPSTFYFQADVPVRYAEYAALIPAYYGYVSLSASSQFDVKEVEQTKRQWGPVMGPNTYGSGTPALPHTSIRYAMRDVPALIVEPYSNNYLDYVPKVRLQLQSVQYPGQPPTQVFSDWTETVNELQARADFGKYYRNRANYAQVWKEAQPAIAAAPTVREKIDAAYYFVANRIGWNGRINFLASEPPNRVLEARSGNSADLNIMLLALLNEAGIPAHPLLVSLRGNGAPIEAYPILTQFDHLMVYTELDGQPLLLDVNGPERPPGLPREAVLNHRGWVAEKGNPRFVNIEVPAASLMVLTEIKLHPGGIDTVDLQARMDSYYGFDARNRLATAKRKDEAPLAGAVTKRYPEADILAYEVVSGAEDAVQPVVYRLSASAQLAQEIGEYVYVPAMLLPALDAALDDMAERSYPVDFPYPWSQRLVTNIKVPDGYAVEELPAAIKLTSADKGFRASFSASQVADKVNVVLTVQLDRTVYPAEAYGDLREMYRRIIAVQEATIVLKRAK